MSLPFILTPTEDASANKKRSTQPRTLTKESAAHGTVPETLLSTPAITEVTSTTSSLSRPDKLLLQRKSVAEGCDAPESPPIVIYGRDINLDQKSHGNQTLLKLIRLNLIPYREAHYDVRAVLVRKIIQQIRDWRGRFVTFNKDSNAWKDLPSNDAIALVRETFDEEVWNVDAARDCRGRYVKFSNKDRNAWKDLPSNDAIALVRGTFDEEVWKQREDIDAAVQRFLPEETAIQRFLPNGMDNDQIKTYLQFTPVQQAKFLKLCELRVYDVEDAVTLIEIPPWTHTAVASPIAALRPKTLQNGFEGEQKRTEACNWVDELMLATQDSEEPLLSRSTAFDNNTPLPDPTSLSESESQQALVQRAKFRKLCQLHVYDVEDAVTLIEIPPWTHTALVSPIAALSSETLQNENEGESKRRKKSRKRAVHVPVRQDAHGVSYASSGERRIRTEQCSWVDTLMLATKDSEESLLSRLRTYEANNPLPDPIAARRHLWGEDTGLSESNSPQVPVPEMDFNPNESPFLW
jgi:hypothetical protein